MCALYVFFFFRSTGYLWAIFRARRDGFLCCSFWITFDLISMDLADKCSRLIVKWGQPVQIQNKCRIIFLFIFFPLFLNIVYLFKLSNDAHFDLLAGPTIWCVKYLNVPTMLSIRFDSIHLIGNVPIDQPVLHHLAIISTIESFRALFSRVPPSGQNLDRLK